ncbi:MAG: T9SS type A sorting domain-containing protein, partial [Flavobacterium sp.]|nr:T9SS type A sorting domain-containing protein [Flavobacterium sp.]
NTNGAKRIFVYCDTNGFGIYKIEVNGATVNTTISMADWLLLLNVKDEALSNINYYVKDKTVYLNNIDTASDILVYSVTGSLVKSIKTTSSDVSFDINQTGLYILKLSNNEGQKTIKLIVN